jgi:hypothetical protein
MRAKRLRKLAPASPRRPIKEEVHASLRAASDNSCAPDNPGGEITHAPEMLEVSPGQRGSRRFAEQEIANSARFKSGQGEKALNYR